MAGNDTLRVKSLRKNGFRRCGRRFSPEPTDIPLSDLGEDEIEILKSDDNLTVVEINSAAAEEAEAEAAKKAAADAKKQADQEAAAAKKAEADAAKKTAADKAAAKKAADEAAKKAKADQAAAEKAAADAKNSDAAGGDKTDATGDKK